MEETSTAVLFKKKTSKSKRNLRKRVHEENSDDEDANKMKNLNRTSKMVLPDEDNTDSSIKYSSVVYESSGISDSFSDQGATASLQTETETTRDSRALFERSLKIKSQLKGKSDDRIYRGLTGYVNNFDNKMTSFRPFYKGPTRAAFNIRPTCQWDYQPDICKDFKETGYCGFGDSCKFLHDRTDYKYGWEMEQTSNHVMTKDENLRKYEIDDSCKNEVNDFKCSICRNSFVKPVVTKCFHYFCEKCALDHFKKNMRCFICNKLTKGIFNPAHKIISK